MKPDYRLIHALEYELGFRDDPPPKAKVHHGPRTPPRKGENPFSRAAMLKELYTDEPGAIIYYDPKQGRPTY